MHTILESIATANPPFELGRDQAVRFMSQLEGISPVLRDRAPKIYAKSGIDRRYTCIPDYLTEPPDFSFFPSNWQLDPAPSTFDRNQLYKTYAAKIAQEAAEKVIAQTGLDAAAITHLIVVSCTGFSAPGLDVHLMRQLGLRSDVDRTLIGFMGCYAAFNGLKTAHAICQSNPKAKVLLVCVELCTLHFQAEDSLESIVVNAIFGDGAAAAILSPQSTEEAVGKLAYADSYSLLTENTLDLMNWTIGNTGFLMQLLAQVPKAIVQELPGYLTTFLTRHGLAQDGIDFWAIHPGGRQIVAQVQSLLELDDALVEDSFAVLREYGNMSSCTILFVLKRLLAKHSEGGRFENGMALAFGPGLTIEGCLFQQVTG
ncbi:MAG: type III polyketide synthase [Alkalinema sp. RU_4_3]|nr:type III polyketide synthase [Alkalinema sp. RU_4_3]